MQLVNVVDVLLLSIVILTTYCKSYQRQFNGVDRWQWANSFF